MIHVLENHLLCLCVLLLVSLDDVYLFECLHGVVLLSVLLLDQVDGAEGPLAQLDRRDKMVDGYLL